MGFAVNNTVIDNGNKTVNKNRNDFFTNASLLQQRTTTKNIYKEQRLQELTKTTIDNVSKQQQQQQRIDSGDNIYNNDDMQQRLQKTSTATIRNTGKDNDQRRWPTSTTNINDQRQRPTTTTNDDDQRRWPTTMTNDDDHQRRWPPTTMTTNDDDIGTATDATFDAATIDAATTRKQPLLQTGGVNLKVSIYWELSHLCVEWQNWWWW